MQNLQEMVQLPYSQDEISEAAQMAVTLRAVGKYNLVMTGILLSLGPEVRAIIRDVLEKGRKEIDAPWPIELKSNKLKPLESDNAGRKAF